MEQPSDVQEPAASDSAVNRGHHYDLACSIFGLHRNQLGASLLDCLENASLPAQPIEQRETRQRPITSRSFGQVEFAPSRVSICGRVKPVQMVGGLPGF